MRRITFSLGVFVCAVVSASPTLAQQQIELHRYNDRTLINSVACEIAQFARLIKNENVPAKYLHAKVVYTNKIQRNYGGGFNIWIFTAGNTAQSTVGAAYTLGYRVIPSRICNSTKRNRIELVSSELHACLAEESFFHSLSHLSDPDAPKGQGLNCTLQVNVQQTQGFAPKVTYLVTFGANYQWGKTTTQGVSISIPSTAGSGGGGSENGVR